MSTTAPIIDQHDRSERSDRPRFSEEQTDSTVLDMLIRDSSCQLWSTEEIARTLGDRTQAIDSINRLAAAGLVHRFGEFVFPTLAARRADELEQ